MKIKTLINRGVWALSALMLSGTALAAVDVTKKQIPVAERDFGMAPHEHWEHVLHEVMIDITVIGIVFALISLWLIFAHVRRSPDQMGQQPKLSTQAIMGWLIIPVAIFLADDIFLFVKGLDLQSHMRTVPADAYEIKVTGSMWTWQYEYPNSVTTYNELVVPKNQPILLRMTSLDVIHSHYMDGYHVTEDVVPGRVSYEWFLPNEIKESVITCREYCGLMHSGMHGKAKVVERGEFDQWLTAQASAQGITGDKSEAVAVANISSSSQAGI